MKYSIIILAFLFGFAGCKSKIEVYPTDSFDTLGVTWMKIERQNIIYYFQGTGVKGASVFTDLHEEAYERLNKVFNAQLPSKLRFFVWTDWEDATQRLGHYPGFALQEECICHIRANQTLGHEMTHILAFWNEGIPAVTYSRFVTEGVAVAFDLRTDDKMEIARAAVSGWDIQSVREFWDSNLQTAPEDIFYPVAGAFMEFLYNKNLHEKYFAMLKHQEYAEAEEIYGKEQLDNWIAEFDNMVGLK